MLSYAAQCLLATAVKCEHIVLYMLELRCGGSGLYRQLRPTLADSTQPCPQPKQLRRLNPDVTRNGRFRKVLATTATAVLTPLWPLLPSSPAGFVAHRKLSLTYMPCTSPHHPTALPLSVAFAIPVRVCRESPPAGSLLCFLRCMRPPRSALTRTGATRGGTSHNRSRNHLRYSCRWRPTRSWGYQCPRCAPTLTATGQSSHTPRPRPQSDGHPGRRHRHPPRRPPWPSPQRRLHPPRRPRPQPGGRPCRPHLQLPRWTPLPPAQRRQHPPRRPPRPPPKRHHHRPDAAPATARRSPVLTPPPTTARAALSPTPAPPPPAAASAVVAAARVPPPPTRRGRGHGRAATRGGASASHRAGRRGRRPRAESMCRRLPRPWPGGRPWQRHR